jgi:ABC-2 type transport system ATP-binding protein
VTHAIEVRGLCKSFNGRRACWDLTFDVERGEVFGLLGPNGAGKTTTLRMLAGLYAPDAGTATVAGRTIGPGRIGDPELRRRIGLLTEHPGFYDRLTGRENLLFFAGLTGVDRAQAPSRANRLLDRFALRAHADRPFAELSRGMKQKLAIARALMHEPEVVFLDEPTVGLDPEATREVRSLISELAAARTTVVLCTHHLAEVERLCSRAAFVAGRLIGVHAIEAAQAAVVRIELAERNAAAVERVRAVAAVRSERVAGACGSGVELVLELRCEIPDAVAALVGAGARIVSVGPVRDPLEDAYLQLLAEARALGLTEGEGAAIDPDDERAALRADAAGGGS